jgi:exopolysaccharide biosynthesis WecB/TagA/CpsF family protein
MVDLGQRDILGIPISAVDYERAVDVVVQAAERGESLSLSALAVHGVMTGVLDQEHGYRLRGLDLVVPDGQPVRWALRWLHGIALPDRVYGPELMDRVCMTCEARGLPIYLFGSTSTTLTKLEAALSRKYPRLEIAGSNPSRFRTVSVEENQLQVDSIRESGARLVFVGLGCPRQEVWAFENARRLGMPVLAVGAAFDFHAGTLLQAPARLQAMGLEWAFRLAMEPRRLWRRYVFLNPAYLSLLLLQGLGAWKGVEPRKPLREERYG